MGSNRPGIAEGEGIVRPLDLNQARPQADLPLKKSNRASAARFAALSLYSQ
jgi:hypothetical protein